MRHRPWGETNDASGASIYRIKGGAFMNLKYKLKVAE
jgi:hypothetical protein